MAENGSRLNPPRLNSVRSSSPLVSILIPAYNAQEWIADAIRSAVRQSWDPKEIIVVDDGSDDNTLTVARQFESKGVRVVTQKNQGAAATRNHAYSLSQGDYIQWLDADDILAPDKISRQIEALGDQPDKRILLSSAFARFTYRYYKAEFVPTPLWTDLPPLEWLLRKMEQNVYMQTATWLVSRQLTEAAGPWDTRLLGDDDGEYFCRLILASNGVRFVPEAKVYYRSPLPESLSCIGGSERRIQAHWLSLKLHISYLRGVKDDERSRAASLTLLHSNLIYFYPEDRAVLNEMELLAAELGRKLGTPRLSWKYSWMVTLFGWKQAKLAALFAPRVMRTLRRTWDRLHFWLDSRNLTHRWNHTDLPSTSDLQSGAISPSVEDRNSPPMKVSKDA